MAEYGYMLSNFVLSARVGRRPVTLDFLLTSCPALQHGTPDAIAAIAHELLVMLACHEQFATHV